MADNRSKMSKADINLGGYDQEYHIIYNLYTLKVKIKLYFSFAYLLEVALTENFEGSGMINRWAEAPQATSSCRHHTLYDFQNVDSGCFSLTEDGDCKIFNPDCVKIQCLGKDF